MLPSSCLSVVARSVADLMTEREPNHADRVEPEERRWEEETRRGERNGLTQKTSSLWWRCRVGREEGGRAEPKVQVGRYGGGLGGGRGGLGWKKWREGMRE